MFDSTQDPKLTPAEIKLIHAMLAAFSTTLHDHVEQKHARQAAGPQRTFNEMCDFAVIGAFFTQALDDKITEVFEMSRVVQHLTELHAGLEDAAHDKKTSKAAQDKAAKAADALLKKVRS